MRPLAPVHGLTLALSLLAPSSALAQGDALSPAQRDSARTWLRVAAQEVGAIAVKPEALQLGARTIPAGSRVTGDVVSVHGPVDVYGTVEGSVIALLSDVIVHPGAIVRGRAVALGGTVRMEGGTVSGEVATITGAVNAVFATPSRLVGVRRSVGLAVGWFLVLALIGSTVAVLARGHLDTIVGRIRDDFSRAFFFGVLGELALLPALVLTCVALAITVVGALLIPFAIVGFLLACAGALALGFIAMSYVVGGALVARRAASVSDSGVATLTALLAGLALFLVLWLLGAVLGGAGFLGIAVRLAVLALTWAALTIGFGATILSRGGTRASMPPMALPAAAAEDDYSWQTPTPVLGVAAARRPTPASRSPEL